MSSSVPEAAPAEKPVITDPAVPAYCQVTLDNEDSYIVVKTYNCLDQLLQQKKYYDFGNVECASNSKYFYDENGVLVKEESALQPTSDELDTTYEYTYNEQGQLYESYMTYEGVTHLKFNERAYDANGNEILNQSYTKYGISQGRKYTYDDAGNMLRETVYNADGDLSYYEEYTYREDNSLASSQFWQTSETTGSPYCSRATDYNENGLIVYYEDYTEDGTVDATHTYTYDADGRLAAEKWINNGEVWSDYTYTYELNEEGLLAKEIVNEPEGKLYETTFTYNEDGNYTQKFTDEGEFKSGWNITYDENGLFVSIAPIQ